MSKSNNTEQKRLRVVVGDTLATCVANANELGVTDKEFQYLTSIPSGYVMVYYR